MAMKIPLLKTNGRYCIVDPAHPRPLGFTEFEALGFFHEGLAIATFEGKKCFVNTDEGFLRTEQDYDELENFVNGIAAAQRDGYWYFINRNGIEVSRRGYEHFYPYENGCIRVRNVSLSGNEDFEGIVNASGIELFPPEENVSFEFGTDHVVRYARRIGTHIKTLSGETILKTRQRVSAFTDDRAIAETNDGIRIVDRNLGVIASFPAKEYFGRGEHFTIDGCSVNGFFNGRYILQHKKKFAFVNTDGERLCDFLYDSLHLLWNGYAIAGKFINGKMKFGFLNDRHEPVIDFKYDNINWFEEGRAAVCVEKKWGLIDEEGNEIIAPMFDQIRDCKNGYVIVSIGDYDGHSYYGQYGLYDRDGNKVCPTIYEDIRSFDGFCAVLQLHGQYRLLKPKAYSPPYLRFDSVSASHAGFYYVEQAGKKYVVDHHGIEYSELGDSLPF